MTQQPGFDPHTGAPSGYGQPQQYGQMVPYQQPAHSIQPLMQPMYANPPARNNTMALMSLIFSLVGLVLFPGLLQLLALIFGIIGKKQIRETGESGAGMATAGIVISSIVLGLAVIGAIIWVIVVAAIGASRVAVS